MKAFGIKVLSLFASVIVVSGCQLFSAIQVETVATSAQKPSQVAVYLAVTRDEASVLQLEEADFTLYENDKKLDNEQVKLRLLSRDVSAEHHTLVLVDLSGPIEEQGARELLATQLVPFVERLRLQQSVSVYGYDGADTVYPLGSFSKTLIGERPQVSTKKALKSIVAHKQADPSSNLNSAVLRALDKLDQHLADSNKPVRIGSLVIITRGPDLAGRTPTDTVEDEVNLSAHEVFALTVGEAGNSETVERISQGRRVHTNHFERLDTQLSDVAALVEDRYNRFYLLSYCSPARRGKRTLLIEVTQTDAEGTEEVGRTTVQFSSDGFIAGCDPVEPPRFIGEPLRRDDSMIDSVRQKQPTDAEAGAEAAPAESSIPGTQEPATAPPPASSDELKGTP